MREAIDLTPEYLQGYLAGLWQVPHVEIVSLAKFPRGMSRETWFIECAPQGPAFPGKLILRRDLPSISVVPTSLRFEYDVYHSLQGSSVPIARTIVFEDRAEKLPDDRPFFLRETVDGDWDDPHYLDPDPAYNPLRLAMAKEHIRKLALIHTLDWKARGFDRILPVPASPADCARCSIERNFAMLAEFQVEPLPVLTEASEWLLDNAPVAPRISLLKGTNGRGEEVFRDGVIVAMSDWEQGALGDPASDFARTQDFVNDIIHDGKKIWGLEQALAYYEELSGIHISVASVKYYQVLACLENLVAMHHAAGPLIDGSDRLVRLVWLTTEASHYANMMLLAAVSNQQVDAALAFSTQTSKVEK